MYTALEILGTVAFAISGAMVAIEGKMDILGVVILGVTTAVGGGIIRDVLIGVTPPASLNDPLYAMIAVAVSLLVFLPPVRKWVNVKSGAFVLIDAVGLGTFTVIGLQAGRGFGNVFLQIFLGVLTGVGGGVMRDIFAAQKPSIFVRNFYALAALCGAVLCTLLLPLGENAAMIGGIVLVVLLRLLAARYRWHLPRA